MPFYPDDAPVPTELRTDEFLLRPLRAADVDRDYEAVMATQETLRRSSGGRWPRPDFTLEENLADLEGHEEDFHARRGFTYTVMDPTETRCLGCVYAYPLSEEEGDGARDDEAAVWFWVRPDGVADDLDRRLLGALIPWLRDDFAFSRVLFRTRGNDERRAAILAEAGLRVVDVPRVRDTEELLFA
jgi:RimJ/RimL family protein N-acetyltransferase